jgi:hypothetical protein
VDYYHVVFTLPAPVSDIAYHNNAVIYHLQFFGQHQHLDNPKDFANYLAPLRTVRQPYPGQVRATTASTHQRW